MNTTIYRADDCLASAWRSFGNAELQIELKPHTAVEAVVALQESPPTYRTLKQRRRERRASGGGPKSAN